MFNFVFRFQEELLLLRDLKQQECMGGCVPKGKSLILHLSRAMSMPYLQVIYHLAFADFCAGQLWVWHALYEVKILSGSFTTNVVAAAPVLYCKRTLDISKTVRGNCVPHLLLRLNWAYTECILNIF